MEAGEGVGRELEVCVDVGQDEVDDGVGGGDVSGEERSVWCEKSGLGERLGVFQYVIF